MLLYEHVVNTLEKYSLFLQIQIFIASVPIDWNEMYLKDKIS